MWWQDVGEQAGPECTSAALNTSPLTLDEQTADVRDPQLDQRRPKAVCE